MQRRKFLTSAGAGLAAGAAATVATTPALSQAQTATLPMIKWRLASSFPKSLDTIYGAADVISKRVAAATGGKFQIQVFAAGEIVPAFSTVDAVQNGTVECTHTAPYYFFGKDPTFAFACAIPFGMNARQQNAWMYHGGGLALMRDFFKDYNIINFPAGNTGAQMGGWFRKEIKTVADLKGLKFRVGGFAGRVLTKLGVVPQQIPGGDIYPSLEKGTIDAAEWVGPYDDEKLGLYKIAKYYYYPGWWEGGPELDLFVNIKQWEALPPEYKAILESACAEANIDMLAKYDALNPAALKRLAGNGVQLRPFNKDIMNACFKAANEVYEEESAKNPKFKKVYDAWKIFRDDQVLWFRVAEQNFDNFMAGAASAAKSVPAKK
jgi:TRAP-type mannitol/chloroaromatic compound transport system substrate-binding protein